MECLCEDQSVTVTAGKCNALDRVGRRIQQFPRLRDAECCQKLLWGHSEVILEQGIEVASVDADIIRHVRHLDRVTVITLDKGDRLFHILVPLVLLILCNDASALRKHGQKDTHLSVPAQVIRHAEGIMLHHIPDNGIQFLRFITGKNRMPVRQSHAV